MKTDLKIMIAGGCGFIGSSLAKFFLIKYKNSLVFIFDNLIRKGSELNLKRIKNNRLVFIKGDLSVKKNFEKLPTCDFFIDAAADPSVLSGINSTVTSMLNNNFISTLNAIEWCSNTGCKFLFLSTSRVYPIQKLDSISFVESPTRFEWAENNDFRGFSIEGIDENFDMNGYRSLYGSSKFSSELFIHEFGKYKNLKFLINRCGMIAGPWQMGKFDQGIISYWVSSHIYRRELKYIGYSGTGKQVRDVLHIDDLCILIDKQINNWSKLESKVFNVGGGKSNSISLLELTELVNTVTGIKVPILKEEKIRDADIRIFITNSQRIKNVLGWEPTIGLKRIVRDTSEWILKNKNNLEGIL